MKRPNDCRTRPVPPRKGTAIFYMIVAMVALCAFCSLAVDLGRVQLVKTELMRAADAGARAAASQIPNDLTKGRQYALQFAALNNADGSNVSLAPSDVAFGSWDAYSKHFTPLSGSALSSANAVQVTARRTLGTGNAVPLLFAQVLGRSTCDVNVSVVAIPINGPSGYGIIGLDRVSMSGSAATDSYKSTDGPYSSSIRRLNGSVASNGPITMSGSAHIDGNASYGIDSYVKGGRVSGSKAPVPAPLDYPPATSDNAQFVNNNASVSQYLQSDGSFKISGSKSATLHSGIYYFKNFEASGGTVINAAVDGPVTIYVTGKFTLSGSSSAYQNRAQNLRVVMLNGSTKADLSGSSTIYLDLYAPLSDVNISGSGSLYGSVVGKTVSLSGSATIHYDETISAQSQRIVSVK